MRHDCLYTSIVGITVWHLGSPNYMLVSSFCFPYYCVKLLYLFSSVHIVFYIAFVTYHYLLNVCIIFCDNWPLARYVLQLILVFTCNSCTILMPYIPSLWVQFFKVFLEALSVYLQPICSFVLSSLTYVFVIP